MKFVRNIESNFSVSEFSRFVARKKNSDASQQKRNSVFFNFLKLQQLFRNVFTPPFNFILYVYLFISIFHIFRPQ